MKKISVLLALVMLLFSRAELTQAGDPDRAIAPGENDQARGLVDELRYTSLAEMEGAGLLAAKLASAPWSGYYWPTYAGQIANRYGDPGYGDNLDWSKNRDYLLKNLGVGKEEQLSPAEKYDLLVGDSNFTLTRKMILAGAPYMEREHEVPTWFGLCHGWAPAAMMMPRPDLGVTARAANGQSIYFSPSDLKALGTLLWANGRFATRFIGSRCNVKEPPRDPGDRETDPMCFDTNPATWHLAVVNQIGVSKRSFVLDTNAGYEVWNQPVAGYEYRYTNLLNGAPAKTLREGRVKVSDLPNDRFRNTRAPGTVYVVGVEMALEYVAENMPAVSTEDHPNNDVHMMQNYVYDLELNANNEIIGGEWRSHVHPDFLWAPAKDAKAKADGDVYLDRQGDREAWDGRSPLPASWREAILFSSEREQPLARIVEQLYKMVYQGR